MAKTKKEHVCFDNSRIIGKQPPEVNLLARSHYYHILVVCNRLVGDYWCLCRVFRAHLCCISHMWDIFNYCFTDVREKLLPTSHTLFLHVCQDQCDIHRPGDWGFVHRRVSRTEGCQSLVVCWFCICFCWLDWIPMGVHTRLSCARYV